MLSGILGAIPAISLFMCLAIARSGKYQVSLLKWCFGNRGPYSGLRVAIAIVARLISVLNAGAILIFVIELSILVLSGGNKPRTESVAYISMSLPVVVPQPETVASNSMG